MTPLIVGLLVASVLLFWLWTRAEKRAYGLEEALRSEQKRRDAEVAAAHQDSLTLTAAVDGMAEGIWLTDAQGTVVRYNQALKEMLYQGQDLLGQRPMFLLRNAELHAAVLAACENGESRSLTVSLDGVRPRALAVRVAPLGRDLKGSSAVFTDITELRRLERVRQDFVANVSHELRTPITAILGYSETLRSGALSDAAHAPQMVEIIHRQSQRLSELVNDLLELSRLDSGELAMRRGPVHLTEVTERAAEVVRPKASSKRLTMSLDVPADLWSYGDEKAVEQVLINLLDNAVKYTPEGGGSVTVRAHAGAGGQVILEVGDRGLGIEPQHLPRLFERFYRVDRGRSRDMGGTGLGLSIVKHLVSAMGGEVRVRSQPGEGSTFTVCLPASSAA
jgi:two-component system phosphate regulon sensor histidine kinase PhoR